MTIDVVVHRRLVKEHSVVRNTVVKTVHVLEATYLVNTRRVATLMHMHLRTVLNRSLNDGNWRPRKMRLQRLQVGFLWQNRFQWLVHKFGAILSHGRAHIEFVLSVGRLAAMTNVAVGSFMRSP